MPAAPFNLAVRKHHSLVFTFRVLGKGRGSSAPFHLYEVIYARALIYSCLASFTKPFCFFLSGGVGLFASKSRDGFSKGGCRAVPRQGSASPPGRWL
eukprot:1195712-Prorocentrum_minimum.AAC.3